MAPELRKTVGDFKGGYFEPFLGGGAAFFALQPARSILSDTNADLINFYRCLKVAPLEIMENLVVHAANHSSPYYYEQRASLPKCAIAQAARFIYLNRSCWNGLYRVNLRGEFNVPKGTKDRIVWPGEHFLDLSRSLKEAEIIISDFEAVVSRAGHADVVYCDPPYTVAHNNNGFVKYNENIFSWADQERLASAAIAAKARGARVYVSNADHPSIRQIYAGAERLRTIPRYSVISGARAGRQPTSELLIEV